MIAIFRQPRADIDVKLERIYFRPGENVEAAVTILPSESFTLRHCSVDLVCVETYYMNHSEGSPSEHKRDLERITEPLLANVEVLKGESIGGVVQFEVPRDAVQSIFGEATRIVWEVQVLVDVSRGRDLHRIKGMIVSGQPPVGSSLGRQESESKHGILTLSCPEIMISAGGQVEGRLELQTYREFSVKDIRVQLERTEWAMDKKLIKTVAEGVLHGPDRLAPNQLLQWPFSFNMPNGALPSVKIGYSGVIWKVKAIAACGLFSDLVVEQEIRVFAGYSTADKLRAQ
ncbi:MAG: hypothetical protein BZY87_10345 [SAR202 cluster bacterium Io17-Chloro-G6]|nr:MAG: hypothetical protein BZY87_10345 [SAR202 cluster bacterium Io17-Chloro-G6]